MIERDYYFASWAIEKGIPYEFKDKQLHLYVDLSRHKELKAEYRVTVKPVFDRIRSIISNLKSQKK